MWFNNGLQQMSSYIILDFFAISDFCCVFIIFPCPALAFICTHAAASSGHPPIRFPKELPFFLVAIGSPLPVSSVDNQSWPIGFGITFSSCDLHCV